MRAWLAAKTALLIGAVLVAINHGDALLQGDVDLSRTLKMLLTVAVSYLVSTTSSVAAIRDVEQS